jgi:hypothetical protein
VFAFAAGPTFSLNWGRLHIHGIHYDRVVGARRRSDGLFRLHGTALRFATLRFRSFLYRRRRIVRHHEVVFQRVRIGRS